ncbi:cupin domain protein [Oxobacter pfennigii]|uniref:Cupin domain protein n=1 Tax=Oxobacter pfennigii TaxID=36849 RepID=A0A0P8WAQ3_9CLOT|nr:cupin domain-containing protein [Oxobacter pfennigii]KPU44799.1 cupin domain protein [Oxobacter pfennigii]
MSKENYKTGKHSSEGYIKMVDGVERKTLVYGNSSLMTEFRLEKGKNLPMHKHENEQTGYLVSGYIILTIDGEKHPMHPGDSWAIEGNIEHGAEIVEDSIAIEVFTPIRNDYI